MPDHDDEFSLEKLDLTPEEREQLAQAQRGLELVRRAVEAENETPIVAIHGATPDGTQDRTLTTDVAAAQPAKSRIGRFEVIREIGRGGFGVVLLARDPRLNRLVALKIPRTRAVASEELTKRFVREAQSGAMLGHPNIVPILESGSVGPVQYIAFEYCPGIALSEWLRSHGRPVESTVAAELVATLAQAVQHAHSRGVVHRDLKPGNVLLYLEDSGTDASDVDGVTVQQLASPRITDFGLAKIIAEDGALTQAGATLGTPAYMSPEQARGDISAIGPQSDIYALGALFYELLTGKVPFTGENNLQTLRAIESSAVPSPFSINFRVPTDLQAVCLKCLEKQPAHRYESAAALEADLRRFLRGEPVLASPPSTWNRVAAFARRNRLLVTLSAIFVAGLLLATGLSTMFGISEYRQRNRADNLLTENQRLFEDYRDTNLALVFDLADGIGEIEGSIEIRYRLVTKTAASLEELEAQSQDEPHILLKIAEAYMKLGDLLGDLGKNNVGDFRGARGAYLKALSIAKKLHDEDAMDAERMTVLAGLENRLGRHAMGERKFEDAERHFRTSQALLEATDPLKKQHAGQLSSLIDAIRGLGATRGLQGDNEAALTAFQQCVTVNRQRITDASMDSLDARVQLAGNLSDVGSAKMKLMDFPGAKAANEEVQQMYTELLAKHPASELKLRLALVHSCYTYSVLLVRIGDLDRMQEIVNLGLNHANQMLASDPANASAENLKGELLFMVAQRHNRLGDEADAAFVITHWQNALTSYRECLNHYTEMRDAGKLRGHQDSYINAINKHIAKVETQIASVSE